MTRETVQANGREYFFSPDDQPPLSSRWCGLVRARVINDVTLKPVTAQITLESDLTMPILRVVEGVVKVVEIPLAVPRIGKDGLVGLVAVPLKVFPVLAAKAYKVKLIIHAI